MGLFIDWLVIVINENDIFVCIFVIGDYKFGLVKFMIMFLMDI